MRFGRLQTVALIAVATLGVDASAPPTLSEVWRVGDDALTQRLADALESAFRALPNFSLSSGKKPGTLVITVPHAGWKEIGPRTQVRYAVEFTSTDNRKLGGSTGWCWEDALENCAAHILADSRIAAQKAR
jgi:hypothetical protein